MTSNVFLVEDHHELHVLQRVFREAKFCIEPDDAELSDSPIVSKLYGQLIDVIISNDIEKEGESARGRWNAWLSLDEKRDEWSAAITRARREPSWDVCSTDERRHYVALLVSPFFLTGDAMDRFIAAVAETQ